jgi:hypothetical protein
MLDRKEEHMISSLTTVCQNSVTFMTNFALHKTLPFYDSAPNTMVYMAGVFPHMANDTSVILSWMIPVFCDVMMCQEVTCSWHFEGTQGLYLSPSKYQKPLIKQQTITFQGLAFSKTAVRTSNLATMRPVVTIMRREICFLNISGVNEKYHMPVCYCHVCMFFHFTGHNMEFTYLSFYCL